MDMRSINISTHSGVSRQGPLHITSWPNSLSMHCASDHTVHSLTPLPVDSFVWLFSIFLSTVLTVSWWFYWHAFLFCFCTLLCLFIKAESFAFLRTSEARRIAVEAFGRFLTLCHVWLFLWQPSILKPGSYGNAFTPLALLLDSPSLLSSVCLSLLLVHLFVVQHTVCTSSPLSNLYIEIISLASPDAIGASFYLPL